MRIMIKGGVWKNTEDEILKAAVMKYGKNQWARISSLLVRKSAKQCKARWYEWLDPSIKKTEWTREEDEKLLHLAKLMPTQWRTIAPIVGRTPSQCLERYEKLLDAACAKDENYEANDDPRKLRPGEIDPNPESKPARPDPVDMDEDEKEMLSEARARLANTRGKKAKRKAREKQLEEARRLASLQKRRELKAAGIDNRHRRRKRKGIDYNAEIPFEKRPPPGFFDVSGEEKPLEQHKFPTTIEELEGKRRVDIEAQLRKQDAGRNRIQQRQDAPAAILQANKLNDPEAVRKRSKLMLPAPQISDQELEEISKMGYANDLTLGSEELAEGSGATSSLVADYSQTPRRGMTSLRTPQRTPVGKVDAIMMEAENLARLRESQTPLLGGQNPELHPSDFTGVTPRKREMLTPNPLATPLASPGPMGLTPRGLTPRIGITPRDGVSGTPTFTPFRDDLHINEDVEVQDSTKLELRRQEELRRSLRTGLTYLPQPKNEYQIVMQPIPEENEESEDKIEEDMSDKIAREKAREQARLDALMKKRSKVLQRELPRPPIASLELIKSLLVKGDEDKSSFVPPTLFEQAEEMINKELLSLLEHDNAKYPLNEKTDKDKVKGAKHAENGRTSNPVPEIEDFDEDELREADSVINEEMEFLRVAMGHENESFDDFIKARDACLEDLMFFPSRNNYGLTSVAGSLDKLAALQNEFEIMKKKMDEEAKKATRLEQKIKVLTHGYQMRAGKIWAQIEATVKQIGTSATELECFQALQKQERAAASYRIDNMTEEVDKQKLLERTLQARYGNLVTEEERLQRILQAHKERLQAEAEMAARKRAAEELAAKQREDEEIAAKKREAEEIAVMMRAAEEIAAKKRADEEEIAAKKRADEEEIAAKKRADEEIAAKKRADEEIAAKMRADEEIAAKKRADEEIAAKMHADEVEIAAKKRADEEIAAKMHAYEMEIAAKKQADEEIAAKMRADEEEIAAKKQADEEIAAKMHADEEIAAKKQADEEIAAKMRADEEEIAAKLCADEEIASKKRAYEEEIVAKKPTDKEEIVAEKCSHAEEIVAKKCEDDPMASEKCEEVDVRKHTVAEEMDVRDCLSKAVDPVQAVEVEAGARDDAPDAMIEILEEEKPAVDEIPRGSETPVETLALTENSVENDRFLDSLASEQAGECQPTLQDDNTPQTSVMEVDIQTDSLIYNPSADRVPADPPQQVSQMDAADVQVEAQQERFSSVGNIDVNVSYVAMDEGEQVLEVDDKNVEDMQEQLSSAITVDQP